MALNCNTTPKAPESFEFIDCSTISISYNIQGLATVSFTVVSTSKNINVASYSTVSFGSNQGARTTGPFSSGRVTYTGHITSYELIPVQGASVYEHKIQLLAWGCK